MDFCYFNDDFCGKKRQKTAKNHPKKRQNFAKNLCIKLYKILHKSTGLCIKIQAQKQRKSGVKIGQKRTKKAPKTRFKQGR